MGVVMLHCGHGQSRFRCVQGREIVRMLVAGYCSGCDFEQTRQVADDSAKRVIGGAVLQITDMLAQKCLASVGQADGIFQLRAYSQERRRLERESYGSRCIAPGAAVEKRAALKNADDGVVTAYVDGAVVDEKAVGNASQAFKGIIVFEGNRLV